MKIEGSQIMALDSLNQHHLMSIFFIKILHQMNVQYLIAIFVKQVQATQRNKLFLNTG